jgi:hypothetical protein
VSDQELRAAHFWSLCHRAAREIFDTREPTERYAEAVTDLLYGTIAHESAMFKYTRQGAKLFTWANDVGAWGAAQCELGSVTDSVKLLKRKEWLAINTARFLAKDMRATPDWLLATEPAAMLRWAAACDDLSVALCRLHYLRIAAPVPLDLEGQDAYYKRFYNTIHGAAKPGDYVHALRRAKALLT